MSLPKNTWAAPYAGIIAAARTAELDLLDMFECVRRAGRGDRVAEEDARQSMDRIREALERIANHAERAQRRDNA